MLEYHNKEDDKYMYIADLLEIKAGFSKIKPASSTQPDQGNGK
jgi:hypothetical protein